MKQQLHDLGYTLKRKFFTDHTYQIHNNDMCYHVLVVPTARQHLVTINSKYIWNIKSGSVQGARFITRSVKVINLQDFLQRSHPIIAFKNMPYKVLKYINESEVVDITSDLQAHNITILPTKKSIVSYIKTQGTNR